uniref:Uncharacterized protein LOC116953103 n=1 Tax=Petromyzon marinus TaxID=7757 RepID=A0AAJ7U447_PETMA|nr:uncharacterized protein LOC116953103 [Petromyzon marinus]
MFFLFVFFCLLWLHPIQEPNGSQGYTKINQLKRTKTKLREARVVERTSWTELGGGKPTTAADVFEDRIVATKERRSITAWLGKRRCVTSARRAATGGRRSPERVRRLHHLARGVLRRLLRTLASQPDGVASLRAHPTLQSTLQRVTASGGAAGPELLEEASVTLRKLQPLPRPPAPRIEVLGPHAVRASWEALQPESGVCVTYRLFDRGEVAYTGPDTSCVLSGLEPHTALSLSLQALSPGDDGPLSAPAAALTDDGPPGPPDDPRLTASAAWWAACGPAAPSSWRCAP